MTFQWSRAGDVIHSRCTLCPFVLTSRLDRDIYLGQRAHDPFTCQQRRLETARANTPEGLAAAKWERIQIKRRLGKKLGELRVSSTIATVLEAAIGTIDTSEAAPDLTPKPPRTPRRERSIHMQNTEASATPSRNSKGVA